MTPAKLDTYIVTGELEYRKFVAAVREESASAARACVQEVHPEALIESVRLQCNVEGVQ